MVTKAEWTERVKRWGKSGLGREEFAGKPLMVSLSA